jgi:hypothetical protein
MSSDADIEKALVKKSVELRCSSLSLSLALAAGTQPLTPIDLILAEHAILPPAAVCILVVPCAAAASYTKAALGAQWALIRAEATDKGTTPQAITVGMFRICYESPIVSCLPFQWGLDLGRFDTHWICRILLTLSRRSCELQRRRRMASSPPERPDGASLVGAICCSLPSDLYGQLCESSIEDLARINAHIPCRPSVDVHRRNLYGSSEWSPRWSTSPTLASQPDCTFLCEPESQL